jgi:hypothetical protein
MIVVIAALFRTLVMASNIPQLRPAITASRELTAGTKTA